jgi:hypothetical protein
MDFKKSARRTAGDKSRESRKRHLSATPGSGYLIRPPIAAQQRR